MTMRYTLLLHYPEMTSEDLGAEAIEEGQRALPELRRGARRGRRPARGRGAATLGNDDDRCG
jgi:hypothetical protein